MAADSPKRSFDDYPLTSVNGAPEQEGLLYDGLPIVLRKSRFNMFSRVLPWACHLVFLAAGITFFVLSQTRGPSEAQCTRLLSPYSPAIEAVEYYDSTWEGDFTAPSVYRGPPSPERDAAWEYLTHDGGIDVPLDQIHKLNKTLDVDWQRTDPELGSGAVGMLEVFHQLHCLNVLRKWTYIEWYDEDTYPDDFKGPDHLVRMHLDHCIEMIRLRLMCTSDVTPFLAVVQPDAPLGKVADFNTFHRCRNFDKIKEWMTTHIVEH